MEFDLIDLIRARVPQRDDVILGIGDDAAVLQVPTGKHLVVATDTLNAGVHFPADTAPADIGWKALAVNLSDLAAMGAQPAWCTLSLSLPHGDVGWLDAFLDGFLALAAQHDVALVGGDTTRGPLSVCVTVHGLIEPGRMLRRDAAQVGDDLWVSGTLGDAAGALALLLAPPPGGTARSDGTAVGASERLEAVPMGRNETLRYNAGATGADERTHVPAKDRYEVRDKAAERSRNATQPSTAALSAPHARGAPALRDLQALRSRLDRPTPRVATGLALVGIAHAGIDLSDGLVADLGHVCRASAVAAEVTLSTLPTSPALRDTFAATQRHELQAAGGDDYELCFTAPASARTAIERIALDTGIALTRIGRIVAGDGVRVFHDSGEKWRPTRHGYVHFAD